jgi:hypothetical protein
VDMAMMVLSEKQESSKKSITDKPSSKSWP